MSAIYRVRQFVWAAGAWVRPEDLDKARRYLSPAALSLFRAMPRYDRRHGLDVLQTCLEAGRSEGDLLAAALLHDIGKTVHPSGRLRLWHRVAAVLMRALRPGLLAEIEQDRPGSWRQPFFVQQHHAALGAALAREAGCSQRTIELIRRHEDPPGETEDPLLAALQAADSMN
jgi:putative nucleotidyltransferase with HDIG domain